MALGNMRHRISIEGRETTTDGAGGFSSEWVNVVELWAEVTPKNGSERFRGMKIEDTTTHIIKTRYKSGINSSQRINFNGRLFNINSVINIDEKDRYMLIQAVEGVAV